MWGAGLQKALQRQRTEDCCGSQVHQGYTFRSCAERLERRLRLRTQLLFQRTTVQIPAPTRWLRTMCNCGSPRESKTLFWHLWAPSTYMVHINTCKENSHIYKIKIKSKERKPRRKKGAGKKDYIISNLQMATFLLRLLNSCYILREPAN